MSPPPMPLPGSTNDHSQLFEGGYYSISDGSAFGIAKILKLEPDTVHTRIYKEHFPQRPRSIDPTVLTLGSIDDQGGFGIGHLPLRLESFMERQPRFLTYAAVEAGELEGYNIWKEAEGGVFS